MRAPDADHRQLVGDVHDRHVALGVQLEESAVAVDCARSRDDSEQIVPETSHDHIADDAAMHAQQLRVDDRADRPVDPVAANPFEQRERVGS